MVEARKKARGNGGPEPIFEKGTRRMNDKPRQLGWNRGCDSRP